MKYTKSIIQDDETCFVCGYGGHTHCHHCIFGNSNRDNSEKYGLKVFLCWEHHEGNTGVHNNRELDLQIKRIAQQRFEEIHGTRQDFIQIFGKSYL